MVFGIEKLERVAADVEEFHLLGPKTRGMVKRVQQGFMAVICDATTEAERLYDPLTGTGESKPSDDGTPVYWK